MTSESLSQERLKELLHYDPLTGLFTRRIKTAISMKIGDIAGWELNGYRSLRIDTKPYLCSRVAFLYMNGSFPEDQVDHINHIRNDNRWCNLREVSGQENMENKTRYRSNKSGVSGVIWHSRDKKWTVQISNNKRRLSIGYFKDFFEACCVRKSAENTLNYHSNHGMQK